MDVTPTASVPSAAVETRRWVDVVLADRARGRSPALTQLLLGALVLAVAIAVLATEHVGSMAVFFGGVIGVFILTGLALVVPWERMSSWWLIAIPLADIIAVGVIRGAAPALGTGLLFIFPVMWLAAGFGLVGLISGVATATVTYWVTVAIGPSNPVILSTILLPVVLVAVGLTSFIAARRAAAQRMLLDKQAALLRQSAERARRQEQLVTEVLDAVDFGIIRIDETGAVTVTNDAHARLQQVLADVEGEDQLEAYRIDRTTRLLREELPLERARRGAVFQDERVWFGTPGGLQRALSFTARRLRDSDGRDAGAVVVSRDVTIEMLAARARDEVISSVSHELRTPLTSILGYIELAIDDPETPSRIRSNLQIADRNAEQLLELVSDVLTASAAADDRVELVMEPEVVEVSAVVRAAVESLVLRAGERGVTIDTARLRPAQAYVDPRRLAQVIDNLLSNAVKYNREGGRVSLQSATTGRWTAIVVEDTGVGMTEDDVEALFQRYYRGVAVRSSTVSGTGLGLAISRDIVRGHGGDITVSSVLGVGSTFTVTLPATRPGGAVEG
ncbi:HAMP domain-containing sensor histidine kinase [Microbacterium sp. ET2]|uniref:sensor histidine kinase n=1 Tax=Microbacterium albipurpureum TaxID=3050384 RepID=UPI00259CFD0F|nr:HAMP domain-containing sensor histidine kinase [Microbacterium sp. ET2 (Ac-2212)]WJL95436.1 HAMP domain-containing sensor histidine kinase [Microbacterium sp. ET2 (Ac-2212)]